ncbi:1-phosphatidylinositol phosphodiesterase-like isoform X2 [Dreissena polymorpha]|nr:1-phosphatidylinositol phosphodiesterase-like isoform X2 [Dreissena polymorpha]XP_052219617.1 1-phosphatidylinositol phosphodiesterase-like isoform X2 [Dreissena polymorpha]XP_052219618.1 1-phosphatidylinositol phosphodiesterase-like isoform X2 [Dreissena polymorpha]
MGNIFINKDPDFWCSTEDPGPERHTAYWMSYVPDSKFLSELSIPGTHNTMSYAYDGKITGLWVRCQSLLLSIQLNMGVRFLDIRCQASNGEMLLKHGGYNLGKLTDTLTGCVNFLQTHPRECVILRIAQENSNLEGLDFRDALEPFLDRFARHILKKRSMPTLGEARGKMVILADYDIKDTDEMMKYGNMIDGNMIICDNSKPDSFSQKMDGIKANIEKASETTRDKKQMYITFTYRYTWLGIECPREITRRSNPTWHYLVRRQKGCLGIVVMDFPGYKVIRDIINNNGEDHPLEIAHSRNHIVHRLVRDHIGGRFIIDYNFICPVEITPSTNPTVALACLAWTIQAVPD